MIFLQLRLINSANKYILRLSINELAQFETKKADFTSPLWAVKIETLISIYTVANIQTMFELTNKKRKKMDKKAHIPAHVYVL